MLPWICGKATFAIVVSSPCMTQAQIIVAVIMPRLSGGAVAREGTSPLMPAA